MKYRTLIRPLKELHDQMMIYLQEFIYYYYYYYY